MINKFIRVNINKNPVEFSCPHCNKVIFTYKEGDTPKSFVDSCPHCSAALNPTGATPYRGDAQFFNAHIGDFYILIGDEYDECDFDVVVFTIPSIAQAASMDGLTYDSNFNSYNFYRMITKSNSKVVLVDNYFLTPLLKNNYLLVKSDSVNYTSATIYGLTIKTGDKIKFGADGRVTVESSSSSSSSGSGGSSTNPSDPQKPGGDMNFDQIT